MLSPEYAAGFFDADGCISTENGGVPQVRLSFTNNHRATLEDFQAELGGTIKRKSHRGTPTYDLRLTNKSDMRRALELMLPHLRVKREQATLALELLTLTTGPGKKLTDEVRERRYALAGMIKEAKAYGRCAPSEAAGAVQAHA